MKNSSLMIYLLVIILEGYLYGYFYVSYYVSSLRTLLDRGKRTISALHNDTLIVLLNDICQQNERHTLTGRPT